MGGRGVFDYCFFCVGGWVLRKGEVEEEIGGQVGYGDRMMLVRKSIIFEEYVLVCIVVENLCKFCI